MKLASIIKHVTGLAIALAAISLPAALNAAQVRNSGICLQIHASTARTPGGNYITGSPLTSTTYNVQSFRWQNKRWVMVEDFVGNNPINKPVHCMTVPATKNRKKNPALMVGYMQTNPTDNLAKGAIQQPEWTRIGWVYANDPHADSYSYEDEEVRMLEEGRATRDIISNDDKSASYITLSPINRTNNNATYEKDVVTSGGGMCAAIRISENEPVQIQSFRWHRSRWINFFDRVEYAIAPNNQPISQVTTRDVLTCVNESKPNGWANGYLTMVHSRKYDGWRQAGWVFSNDPYYISDK